MEEKQIQRETEREREWIRFVSDPISQQKTAAGVCLWTEMKFFCSLRNLEALFPPRPSLALPLSSSTAQWGFDYLRLQPQNLTMDEWLRLSHTSIGRS